MQVSAAYSSFFARIGDDKILLDLSLKTIQVITMNEEEHKLGIRALQTSFL
jgi:hypothetical protein